MSATKVFLQMVLGDDQRDAGQIRAVTDWQGEPQTWDCPDCAEDCSVFQVRGRELVYCPECINVWRVVDEATLNLWCAECSNDIDESKGTTCAVCRLVATSGAA